MLEVRELHGACGIRVQQVYSCGRLMLYVYDMQVCSYVYAYDRYTSFATFLTVYRSIVYDCIGGFK